MNKEAWLWCTWCDKFFQVKDLVPDERGSMRVCPFCGKAGINSFICYVTRHIKNYPSHIQEWYDRHKHRMKKGTYCPFRNQPDHPVWKK